MDRATAGRVAGSPRVSRMALRASHAERLSEGTVLLSRARRGQALVRRWAILAIRLEGCVERLSDAVQVHHEVATRHGVERRARDEVGAAFVGAAPDEVPARFDAEPRLVVIGERSRPPPRGADGYAPAARRPCRRGARLEGRCCLSDSRPAPHRGHRARRARRAEPARRRRPRWARAGRRARTSIAGAGGSGTLRGFEPTRRGRRGGWRRLAPPAAPRPAAGRGASRCRPRTG